MRDKVQEPLRAGSASRNAGTSVVQAESFFRGSSAHPLHEFFNLNQRKARRNVTEKMRAFFEALN
jgi:hypothetical protein